MCLLKFFPWDVFQSSAIGTCLVTLRWNRRSSPRLSSAGRALGLHWLTLPKRQLLADAILHSDLSPAGTVYRQNVRRIDKKERPKNVRNNVRKIRQKDTSERYVRKICQEDMSERMSERTQWPPLDRNSDKGRGGENNSDEAVGL